MGQPGYWCFSFFPGYQGVQSCMWTSPLGLLLCWVVIRNLNQLLHVCQILKDQITKSLVLSSC